jgi:hypothetical protein
MNLRTVALAVASIAATTTTTAFAAEGTFSRSLSVSGAPTITIATGSGYIHVSTGPQGEVRINARVKTEHSWFGGGSDADRVRQITDNPPIVQNGNAITVGSSNGDSSRFRNISIDYDVVLPAATTLKVASGSGDIQVANVMSLVSAETGSGDIHIANVGPTPRVSTGSGSIRAEGVHGAASLETGSGDIEFNQQAAGDVKAQTGSGSIRLHGVNGALKAETGSGDIEIDGNPASEWRLESGSGSVRLSLNPQARYTLNASTSSGSVNVSAPIVMQTGLDKQHIAGSVHGGGPTIRINTGSGDITVR